MKLEGSCHCGAVHFRVESHTPYPYMRCYCSICRKTAGGGGYAINIMGEAATLKIRGAKNITEYRARLAVPGRRGARTPRRRRHALLPDATPGQHRGAGLSAGAAHRSRTAAATPGGGRYGANGWPSGTATPATSRGRRSSR